jgi:DNA repair protein RecN (Recombination protein N)
LRAGLKDFLDENGLEPCSEHTLILKRAFSAAGANRQFINGSPATLNILAALGEWLVDMHGPHDHQSLFHPARQLAILDAFGRLEPQREAFAELVRQRQRLQTDKAALIVDERTYAQQLDLLRFQVNEIRAARLQPDEGATLDAEYRRASNAARLLELAGGARELMSETDSGLLTQLGVLGRLLQELQRLDPATAPLAGTHETAAGQVRDLAAELGRYADKLELDPARLRELEERLNLLHSLKRKYGSTLFDVIAFGDAAARKLQSLEQREVELARIQAELEENEGALRKAGDDLSARRRKVIPQLAKAAGKELADLGFKQSRFDVELQSRADFASPADALPLTGFDRVEFQFAPNPGEPPRPLRAIASSGEMARVMLALKTVLAAEDEIPVLVFDEVDANVGGETANAVGDKMRQIAQQRQVLCITHLAPVAAAAGAHFVVDKQTRDGRTISLIRRLERSQRPAELGRMLGGGKAALQHAEALLRG